MMGWFLYVLECRDGSLYTGITTDVERRFKEHMSGKGAKYTRSRLPLRLQAWWPAGDRSRALRLEHRFKSLSKKEKTEAIKGDSLDFLLD